MRAVLSRFSLIFALVVAGQAFAEPEDSAKPEDCSAAFELLVAAGLPKIDKSAKWVEHQGRQDDNYETREMTMAMKGQAWLMESADGSKRIVPMGQLTTIETKSEGKGSAPSGIMGRMLRGGGRGNGGGMSEADLAKDVTKLITGIDKAISEQARRGYYQSMGTGTGFLLIFAAQLHQAGHSDLANRLAQAFFKLHSSRESAVDAAVDRIADYYYQEATQAFFKSGDWKAYQQSLGRILERFPRGWVARDAVRLVMKGVSIRASGSAPPKLSLPNQKLDPKALKLAEEISEMKLVEQPGDGEMSEQQRMMMMQMGRGSYGGGSSLNMNQGLWLLGAPQSSEDSEEPDSPKQDTCISRLVAMKMAALPVLAALTDDAWPTKLPFDRSGSSYYSRESDLEKSARAYMSMPRPMTRGEIAVALLVQTLPDRQDDLDELDASALREHALNFWNEHKNDSLQQLAEVFLRDGSDSQSQEAAEMLAGSSDPKAQQLFEKLVIEAEDVLRYYSMVEEYLRERRAASKPFFEAYTGKLREIAKAKGNGTDPADPFGGGSDWMVREAGGVEKMIQKLELLVGTQSPQKLVMQIAAGKPEDAEQGVEALMAFIKGEPTAKRLELLLGGAEAAQDVAVRAVFLESVPRMFWNGSDDSSENERTLSDAEKKIWNAFMSDERVVPEGPDRGREHGEKSTIAQLAASVYEMSISQSNYYKIVEAQPILDRPINEIFLERAKARLAGQSLPALPDAEKVSKDRLAAIVAMAGSKEGRDIHSYVKSLTPDERAAWRAWMQDPGELAMPENVKKLRFQVVELGKTKMEGFEDAAGLSTMGVGFEVSTASLQKAVEAVVVDLQKLSRSYIRISSSAQMPGLELTELKVPIAEKPADGENLPGNVMSRNMAQSVFYQSMQMLEQSSADGVVLLAFYAERKRGFIAWNISNGKPERAKPDADGLSRYGQEALDLDETFKELREEPGLLRLNFTITILSKADADKIKQSMGN